MRGGGGGFEVYVVASLREELKPQARRMAYTHHAQRCNVVMGTRGAALVPRMLLHHVRTHALRCGNRGAAWDHVQAPRKHAVSAMYAPRCTREAT